MNLSYQTWADREEGILAEGIVSGSGVKLEARSAEQDQETVGEDNRWPDTRLRKGLRKPLHGFKAPRQKLNFTVSGGL